MSIFQFLGLRNRRRSMTKSGGFCGVAAVALVAIIVAAAVTTTFAATTPEHKEGQSQAQAGVKLRREGDNVVMDNGVLQVTFAVPEGYISGISYNGMKNVLETQNKQGNRGYWDANWQAPGLCHGGDCVESFAGSHYTVIHEDEERTEISFSSKWDPNSWKSGYPRLPANIDRRYVMLRGISGLYSYAILEREEGWPGCSIFQMRAVFKTDESSFRYMALTDDIQRTMPTARDRETGKPLAYKEAVLLTNPSNPDLKGQVDDKYQFSLEDKDIKLHGWISYNPSIGFWMITPSNEYRTGGPLKQDLTSHTGPTTLQMFHSSHYAGEDVKIVFEQGETWKKVFGPFFVYLNRAPDNVKEDPSVCWKDAKRQMTEEAKKWPYDFPASQDFAKLRERGFVSGLLLVNDRFASKPLVPGSQAWVGLAARGEPGSWQTETKGYQFWAKADKNGQFVIKGVAAGTYSLYAFVPGVIGDYKYEKDINVAPWGKVQLGHITYSPLRNGPALWEIGVADRSAGEFFIPDPRPDLQNKLFKNKVHYRFKQYGLWDRYTDLYPKQDLVYNVGSSNYAKDWFFAHVTRRVVGPGNNVTYEPTTWQVKFPLKNVDRSGNYTLRLALAAVEAADVQVRFNDLASPQPHFSTTMVGKDNCIARHGIHGLYRLYNVDVSPSWLRDGVNTMFLSQPRSHMTFEGAMYDYIRLEGPSGKKSLTNVSHGRNYHHRQTRVSSARHS